jgi:hypothetical protein
MAVEKLLQEALALPREDRARLVEALALRSQITRDHGSECKDTSAAGAKLAIAAPDNLDRLIKLGRK